MPADFSDYLTIPNAGKRFDEALQVAEKTDTAGIPLFPNLDHAAIFILIAGTFTPVHGILFVGLWRWGMLSLIWAAAVTGITLKTIFFSSVSELLGLTFYLGLGWVGLVSTIVLWRRFSFPFIQPLLWGALAYTIGAILGFIREPILIPGVIGSHELFHIAVLIGIGYHWKFVHQIAAAETPTAFPAELDRRLV